MKIDPSHKVVVITGASAGVGRAVAREFGQDKAKVALLARGKEALHAAKDEVEGYGGEAMVVQVDMADPEAVDLAAEKIETEFGPINIWINNAMNSVFAPFMEIDPRDYKRVTEVTYLGQVYGTLAALKRMKQRDSGSIVLVGSALAYRGIPLQSAYCGAKHGVQGFFDSLRCELIHDKSKIKLSMVELPALNTTQFGWVKTTLPNKPRPMGKVYQPEIAAKAIKYAALHGRRELFVGWPTFQAIIANKIAPGIVDRVLANEGYKGQQTDEPIEEDRQNNLWEPVPGKHSAHGSFDNIATYRSPMLWVSLHRQAMLILLGVIVILLGLFLI